MTYRVDIRKSNGNTFTVLHDNLRYTDNLNSVNKGEAVIPSKQKQKEISVGDKINIYRKGVLDFAGFITSYTNTSQGLFIEFRGAEGELSKYVPTYSTTIYKQTASNTIITNVLTDFDPLVIGAITNFGNIDFKVTETTPYQVLKQVLEQTGQEIEIVYQDFTNTRQFIVNIVNQKGSSLSTVLNEDVDINAVKISRAEPQGNEIKVFGQGDGVNQIINTAGTGTNATSQAQFGVIDFKYSNGNIISQSQADNVAGVLADKLGVEQINATFSVQKKLLEVVSGDILTINTKSDGELSLSIVGVEKGIDAGNLILDLKVVDNTTRILENLVLGEILRLRRENDEKNNKNQNTTNLLKWGEQGNRDSATPLIIPFNLKATDIEDDAGNVNINSITLDLDIDEFKTSGAATYNGGDINVQGSSSDKQNVVLESGTTEYPVTSGGNSFLFWTIGTFGGKVPKVTTFTMYINRRWSSANQDWNVNRGAFTATLTNTTTGDIYFPTTTVCQTSEVWVHVLTVEGDISGDTVQMDVVDNQLGSTSGNTYGIGLGYSVESDHDHLAQGSMNVLSTDLNNIVIGDGVGESGAVNATGYNWELHEYISGAWMTRAVGNGTFTGATFENDIDISGGGVYPNQAGYWRVLIYPNSASPDFVKGVVNIKHKLNNSQ